MHVIRTLIWYAFLVALLIGLYHVAVGFSLVIVDDGYTFMEPALEQRSAYLLDRRTSAITALSVNDVIVFKSVDESQQSQRMFGRVLATPGKTITIREGRFLVDGQTTAPAPVTASILATGLIVPKDSVFVTFDSPKGDAVPLSRRLVPYRDIIGRVRGK